jgi:predicted secreted hydrolase
VAGRSFAVEGLSWNDHEWSTSALGGEQVGWDWFALQLSDGRDVMFYQLRRRDGTPSPFTNGVVVAPDGVPRPLAPGDVAIDVLDTWASSRSGAVYPARWRFRVPSEDLDLRLVPYVADQEMDLSVRYWEGAVRLDGTAAGEAVTGHGYVEMTGYGEGGDEERGRRGPGG